MHEKTQNSAIERLLSKEYDTHIGSYSMEKKFGAFQSMMKELQEFLKSNEVFQSYAVLDEEHYLPPKHSRWNLRLFDKKTVCVYIRDSCIYLSPNKREEGRKIEVFYNPITDQLESNAIENTICANPGEPLPKRQAIELVLEAALGFLEKD